MEIDLAKPEVVVSGEQPGSRVVPGKALRSRIRELISAFLPRERPIAPSDADLLNEYLTQYHPQFASVLERISGVTEEMKKASGRGGLKLPGTAKNARAGGARSTLGDLEAKLVVAISERADMIAAAAASDHFLSYRAESKARFHDELAAFEQEAAVIRELKPYLAMPSLPDVEATELSADVILTLLSGFSRNAPLKGQMVLLSDETLYTRPQFFPRSALAGGIPKGLCSGMKIVPVPFAATHTLAVEALTHGAFERAGRVYFPVEDARPVSSSLWTEIDRFLPFGFRSLTVPLAPFVAPGPSGFDFVRAFGRESWSIIEGDFLDKHAGVCLVCGEKENVSAFPQWRFREPVGGSCSPGVQILDGFIAYCRNCADALRPSIQSLLEKARTGYVLKVDRERNAWLRQINRWNDRRYADYVRDAYLLAIEAHRRRSQNSWIIDLSSQKSLFFKLEPHLEMEDNGWIGTPDGQFFKIVGVPFYDGDTSRNFFPRPSIFEVPWGSSMDDVIEQLDREGFTAIDNAGMPRPGRREFLSLSRSVEEGIAEVSSATVEEIPVDLDKRPSLEVHGERNKLYESLIPDGRVFALSGEESPAAEDATESEDFDYGEDEVTQALDYSDKYGGADEDDDDDE